MPRVGLRRLVRDRAGQGVVEYALLMVLVALVVIGAAMMLGRNATDRVADIGDAVAGAPGAAPRAQGGTGGSGRGGPPGDCVTPGQGGANPGTAGGTAPGQCRTGGGH